MVTAYLLNELRARGVILTAQDGQLLTTAPRGAITPELGAAIRVHKSALLQALQEQVNMGGLDPLPEPLARMVSAAVGNHLNRPGFIPSGIVPSLGDYVLAGAALYAAGREPKRQLTDLWDAYGAWQLTRDRQ
jgi:hypothetical protein